MEEILLDNGFTDKGQCAVCGGSAKLFNKVVGNRLIKVKVYGAFSRTTIGVVWKERGDAMIEHGANTRVTKSEYLQTTLDFLHFGKNN